MSTRTERPYIQNKDISPDDSKRIWAEIVEAGQESFRDTNIVQIGNITEKDIEAILTFFRRVESINPTIFNSGLQDHLYLTSLYLSVIGTILNEKGEQHNIHELELLGHLHDLGRTFSHRKGRNEKIANVFCRKVGIRSDLTNKLPPDEIFNPLGSVHLSPEKIDEKLADINRVIKPEEYRGFVLLSDLLGKRDKNTGTPRKWASIATAAHVTLNPNYRIEHQWPSEISRMKETLRPGHREAVNILYVKLGNWAEERLGMKIDKLTEKVKVLDGI